jgi:hypothetical protein
MDDSPPDINSLSLIKAVNSSRNFSVQELAKLIELLIHIKPKQNEKTDDFYLRHILSSIDGFSNAELLLELGNCAAGLSTQEVLDAVYSKVNLFPGIRRILHLFLGMNLFLTTSHS